jgi:hypothetical protein
MERNFKANGGTTARPDFDFEIQALQWTCMQKSVNNAEINK